VGGGVPGVALSVDVLEAPDGRLLANEVNHTPEFHGARAVAGLDLADAYVESALTGLGQPSK
jgi:[lysine-biosynthesis-protein LysW]--L-2-aminoadipate ligase